MSNAAACIIENTADAGSAGELRRPVKKLKTVYLRLPPFACIFETKFRVLQVMVLVTAFVHLAFKAPNIIAPVICSPAYTAASVSILHRSKYYASRYKFLYVLVLCTDKLNMNCIRKFLKFR